LAAPDNRRRRPERLAFRRTIRAGYRTLGYIHWAFAGCAQQCVNFVVGIGTAAVLAGFLAAFRTIPIMSDSFLPGAKGTQDRHLIFQLSLLAITLIAAGLGLMLLG
jgi:hypothetical protein